MSGTQQHDSVSRRPCSCDLHRRWASGRRDRDAQASCLRGHRSGRLHCYKAHGDSTRSSQARGSISRSACRNHRSHQGAADLIRCVWRGKRRAGRAGCMCRCEGYDWWRNRHRSFGRRYSRRDSWGHGCAGGAAARAAACLIETVSACSCRPLERAACVGRGARIATGLPRIVDVMGLSLRMALMNSATELDTQVKSAAACARVHQDHACQGATRARGHHHQQQTLQGAIRSSHAPGQQPPVNESACRHG